MKNLGSISNPKDVTTKEYVDSKAGGGLEIITTNTINLETYEKLRTQKAVHRNLSYANALIRFSDEYNNSIKGYGLYLDAENCLIVRESISRPSTTGTSVISAYSQSLTVPTYMQTFTNKTINGDNNSLSNIQLSSIKQQASGDYGKYLKINDSGLIVPAEVGGSLPPISTETADKVLSNDGENAEWVELSPSGEVWTEYNNVFVPYSSRCTILDQSVKVSNTGWKVLRIQFQLTESFYLFRQNEWYSFIQPTNSTLAAGLAVMPKEQPYVRCTLINPKDNENVDVDMIIISSYWNQNSTTKIWEPVTNPTKTNTCQVKSRLGNGDIEMATTNQSGAPLVFMATAIYR